MKSCVVQARRQLGVGDDGARLELPARRRLHVDVVVVAAAAAVDDPRLRALGRGFDHRCREASTPPRRPPASGFAARARLTACRVRLAAVVADHHLHQRLALPHFAARRAGEVAARRREQVGVALAVAGEQRVAVLAPQRLDLGLVLVGQRPWCHHDLRRRARCGQRHRRGQRPNRQARPTEPRPTDRGSSRHRLGEELDVRQVGRARRAVAAAGRQRRQADLVHPARDSGARPRPSPPLSPGPACTSACPRS